ncbi:hypothetical protein [Roseomonas sp. CECT 9278]|uniref:hypothetical protein n=1 Tax=Roseomonas sp. CECT 9278 TaxID=2845823 RepID=UPI001E42D502|nr:hypothetical protein [Roseomonas sp. CECT 9278]CAH0242479.1 hypothetical protein ROS9278_02931 [Roseomonas sp. CECT 9278]
MTTLPSLAALRPAAAGISTATAATDRPLAYAFDETCSILVGWQRRDGVLRMLSPTRAVVGGVAGLRAGDSLRLVLYRDEVVVRDCRVTGTTLQGVELSTMGGVDAREGALQ